MSRKAGRKHPDWLFKKQYVQTLVCTVRVRTPGLGCSAMAGMSLDVVRRGMPLHLTENGVHNSNVERLPNQ
jgi:hypothetical protein